MALITWMSQIFYDPLSRALAPLADGFLRRAMLRLGVAECQLRLNGILVHYYYRPALRQRVSRRRRMLSVVGRAMLGQRHTLRPTPILLIHGLGDNALTWTFILELLAPDRDIYAIDLPGYGFSGLPNGQLFASMDQMRSVLESFLQEVIKRPTIVVGNSMGGWLAVRMAHSVPQFVREIVLINPGGAMLDGRASWESFLATVAVPDLKTTRQVIQQVLGFIPAIFVYIGLRSIQARFQHQVVRSFVEHADERDFLAPEELQHISVRTALVWGLGDHFLPAGSLEFFRANLIDQPMLLIQRCGHLPQRERPLLVARFLDAEAARADIA
ncbi:MAG: alpha/beta fold hydrolase [Roseiflexaceae bacterium]|nr:alpha/beta fold hydrolase [Roseiflexaceae bacterium]